ncbi:related to MAK32 protein [Melanopsichium pennsylvanicum]|uniref:Related to MAK32 protein n=2 Tax=Melanopsichium pennsylvanicum TaxID=63383 RepID=A0AAJ5C5P3_9BASI|nr:related to MAK32 protein [Melanopsichium pennsylvanicum 4]SNX84946.1 related to MAK32 protein [Melanopsichium pennsylvanicum]
MGMFIIDTFSFLDPITSEPLGNNGLNDQIGGGGCYFAVGARVFLPPCNIQMIIDRGCDWRPSDQAVLDCFDQTCSVGGSRSGSMWKYRSRPDGTTRAVNIYKGEHRGFDYLSPKIRLQPADLQECNQGELPEWFHLICSPERALETIAQVDNILRREEDGGKGWPKLIYEPIPDSCAPENLQECLRVLPKLQVFSPNHEEAACLLGLQHEWEKVKKSSTESIVDFITNMLAGSFVEHLMQSQEGIDSGQDADARGPIICIRSGAWGSVVGRAGLGFSHVPAWHTPSQTTQTKAAQVQISAGEGSKSSSLSSMDTRASKIKDVTGAGNSFLGGFAAYLVKTEETDGIDEGIRLREAAMHGAVSASLIIEQLGLPHFKVQEGVGELWNGDRAEERLQVLRERAQTQ